MLAKKTLVSIRPEFHEWLRNTAEREQRSMKVVIERLALRGWSEEQRDIEIQVDAVAGYEEHMNEVMGI